MIKRCLNGSCGRPKLPESMEMESSIPFSDGLKSVGSPYCMSSLNDLSQQKSPSERWWKTPFRSALKPWVWTRSFLVFTNLWVAICFTLFAAASLICLRIQPHLLDLYNGCLIFFSVWLVYLLDRLVDPPDASLPQRRYFWRRHFHWQIAGLLTSALGVLWSAAHLPMHGIIMWSPAGLLAVGYSLPATRWGFTGLRQIPYFKVFLIALVWTYASMAYVYIPEPLRTSVGEGLKLGCIRFFWLLAITLPFDMRDIRIDARRGIRTLPQKIGLRNSWWLSIGCAWVSLLGTLYWFGHHPALAGWLASYLWLFAALWAWRKHRSEAYYAFVLDGSVGIQALLLMFSMP